VVSTQYPFAHTQRNPHNRIWHFNGRFTDNGFGPFGATAVGQPLAVRAVVKAGHHTAYPTFKVTVVSVSGCPKK